MEVTQVYNLVNTVTSEILGESGVVLEDLSNVVDIGKQIFNANAVDRYVKSLVNHIGKVIFVDRVYKGSAPSVMMDAWEYGSIMEKISVELPLATENESWELESGTSYDPNIFTAPKVNAKFYNSKVTFEVPISITERQVKQSFSSATQLNGFVSMLYTSVDNSMTIKNDALIMRVINTMTAETLYDEYSGGAMTASSGVKAVNLLYLYNTRYNETLTADEAITTPEFVRFASYMMKKYITRMSKISDLFNVGKMDRFTPYDRLHFVMLADFADSADIYLQSDVFHNEFTKLPNAERVPYWQGSGQTYDFSDISAINIKTPNNHTVEASGILGVLFDRYACGVSNPDRRVTSNYNGKAEFWNYWYKADASYFCDLNENFVVFFVA